MGWADQEEMAGGLVSTTAISYALIDILLEGDHSTIISAH